MGMIYLPSLKFNYCCCSIDHCDGFAIGLIAPLISIIFTACLAIACIIYSWLHACFTDIIMELAYKS